MMSQEALPLYLQIASELRQNIQESVFKVGDRLPTETELSGRFGVNRHTLRRAMEVLRNEGIVDVERGRGTFVVSAPITVPIGKRVRFNESLKAQSIEPKYKIVEVSEIRADAKTAQQLEIPVGDPVIVYERLSLTDEVPLSLASGHFPGERFPNLLAHCKTYHSISEMLRKEYGCDHIRRSTRLSARIARPNDARLLRMPVTSPILLSESVNVDQSGRVVEYGITRFRGDRMELIINTES
ncbi:phosphonate metabolism transcriptional regulator PhnF [Oscillatoria sp. CS-180]|uniref:phosphonate metabolism transcriptional regulator PhnF n=1 Tax=Oscillatoria sp. CS-180 TaxID=3021720 RepID=UPI00232DD473|nr:phosphonate metabolism transcriptional regulator PhnF [Oscillatoria sp. CS-180]MDB9529041.1 phosphonate metabolism transcriptional regulator PhnF [Oscillatoria sp. CS-180]